MTFHLPSALLEADAVRLSPKAPFTWASGLRAPIYCDNRQLLGHPATRRAIGDLLSSFARESQPTLIAGTSTAGIPWATLVADVLGLPLAYVRPEPKKHGMGRQVEGPLATDQRIVLIEDLLSTGGSSLKCVEALRNEGGTVLEVLALFSYGLPQAEAAFEAQAVPFRVLATFDHLATEARSRGVIDAADWASLQEWKADTAAWSGRFA